MTEDNTNVNSVDDLLKDTPYADLADDAEIPAELLQAMDGEQLSAVFVEQMMADKGVEPTDEIREELMDKMSLKVSREIVASLPDYMVDQVNKMMARGRDIDDAEVQKIFDEAGIDVDTITTNAMMSFRNEYLNGKENA